MGDLGVQRGVHGAPEVGRLDVHDACVGLGCPDRGAGLLDAVGHAQHDPGPAEVARLVRRPHRALAAERRGDQGLVEWRELPHQPVVPRGDLARVVADGVRIGRVGEGAGQPGRGAVVHEVGDHGQAEVDRGELEDRVQPPPVPPARPGVDPVPRDAVPDGAVVAGQLVLVEGTAAVADGAADGGVLDADRPEEPAVGDV